MVELHTNRNHRMIDKKVMMSARKLMLMMEYNNNDRFLCHNKYEVRNNRNLWIEKKSGDEKFIDRLMSSL